MRFIDVAIALGGMVSLVGCAHARVLDTTAPAAAAVASYRAVRAGVEPVSVGDAVRFCAADDAVEVVSNRARSTDDWADKFRDSDLQREVRDVVARDPALAGQSVTVRVHEGEAIIGGTLQHDADAVAAARDALAVPGVIAVQLRATSTESPVRSRLVATNCP
jgi:osmotically-inducible protein OsmY